MTARTRNIILAIIGALVVLCLCAIITVASFFVVQRSAITEGEELSDVQEETGRATLELPEATSTAIPTAEGELLTEEATAVEVETTPIPTQAPPPPETPTFELRPQEGERSDFSEEDLELLWEAWNIVRSEFDGDIPSDKDLTYAAIQGLLESLDDDYTRFAPPDVAARLREDLQGSFEGIGAFVRENEEGLTEIVRPMAGQPAALAGLRAGDVVVAVDGDSVLGQGLDEVIALIRGPEGTEVTLTIHRDGEEESLDFTVRRELIEIPIIESEMLEENIAYVRLTSFNSNADAQLRLALSELLAQNPVGLIFDLRDNPGGFLDQSVAVADVFLPQGVVLYERSSTFAIDEAYRSDNGDLAEEIPLVVLVNAGSASASEIVAGAIQDRGRGTLIGETTFGKGSVQQTHTLSDGSEIRVTIARWYTPDDESIDGNGIAPDIEAETPLELRGEDDLQLQRAIEFLLTGE